MLSQAVIEEILGVALQTGGDFSEVFVEDRYTNNLTLQSGKVERSLSGRDFGVGIRVFKDLMSVYAYTTDASREGLLKAAKSAAAAIEGQARMSPSAL